MYTKSAVSESSIALGRLSLTFLPLGLSLWNLAHSFIMFMSPKGSAYSRGQAYNFSWLSAMSKNGHLRSFFSSFGRHLASKSLSRPAMSVFNKKQEFEQRKRIKQFDDFWVCPYRFDFASGCRCHRKFCSHKILQPLYNFLENYAAQRHNFSGNYAAARKFCRSSSARQTSLLLAFLSLDKTGALQRAKIQVLWDMSSGLCGGEFHP